MNVSPLSIAITNNPPPRFQRLYGIRVSFPEFPEPAFGDHPHDDIMSSAYSTSMA
jgi:hypothetical protein